MSSNEALLTFSAYTTELEQEAHERYAKLADSMAAHHSKVVADFFGRMAEEVSNHLAEVTLRCSGEDLPVIRAWQFGWPGTESPETASYEAVHYRMTLREAMMLALANERAAESFYRGYGLRSQDASVQRLAAEEISHAQQLELMLQDVPEVSELAREENDPPVAPEQLVRPGIRQTIVGQLPLPSRTLCRSAWRTSTVALLSVLLLGASVCATAQNLRLTLAAEPPGAGVYTTRVSDALSLTVAAGQRVSFARSEGRDYRLQSSGGLFWAQVQEVPREAEFVAITPLLREDGSFEVTLEVSRKSAGRQQSYSSELLATPGTWTQLFGPATQHSRSTKVYGTQQLAGESLYLLLEPLGD
ncbi:MAG: rubrerythrin [Halieaceae bacterium]|jgi:rubrerythrin